MSSARNVATLRQGGRLSEFRLSPCPKSGEGVHTWLLSAAHQCRRAGLTEAEAEALIADQMTRPPSSPNEVGDAVEKGYSSSSRAWKRPSDTTRGDSAPPAHQAGANPPRQQLPPRKLIDIEFDPAKLAAVASRITMPHDWRYWLWERSPKVLIPQCGFAFLANLYREGERVHVFDRMVTATPAQTVTIALNMNRRVPDYIRRGGTGAGIWFSSQPVDGGLHHNPRKDNEPSCRSEESVTSFRYAVLESDRADPSQWLAFIAQSRLRIAAIYTSGGRSIHTLIRVDASSKDHWDSIIEPWKRPLKVLGGDPGCLTAVRLTRLPGCHRPEKGGFQQLLYLAPKPVEARLIDLPQLRDRAQVLSELKQNHPRWNKPQEALQ